MRDAVHRAATTGPVRGFFDGVGLLGRGLGMWATSPRLMLLGAIPALIVTVVYGVLLVLFFLNLEPVVTWLTPFADGWDPFWTGVLRFAGAAALVLAALLIAVYTFTAITLAVGDPFYERIWRNVELQLGGIPDDTGDSVWTSLRRGIGNALGLLLATAAVGLGVFAVGFIPVVGTILAPALSALLGGWFLAVELCGFAFDGRGFRLRERRRMLALRRSTTVGFGAAVYLLFLIPFAAVFVMPAAVAGATLLSRAALERAAARRPAAGQAEAEHPATG